MKPTTELVKKQMEETTGSGMAKLNGIFKATVSYLYFSNEKCACPTDKPYQRFTCPN